MKRGAADKDVIEVLGDLKAGDEVIVPASDEIRDGTTVTVRRGRS